VFGAHTYRVAACSACGFFGVRGAGGLGLEGGTVIMNTR